MKIRPESADDHAAVEAVVTAAFGSPLEARLVAALREEVEPSISLVAENDRGEVVGHIFFSPVTLENAVDAPGCAALAPVSVEPRHQNLGVGSALIRSGLAGCRKLGWRAVFLVGDPLYYRRFGFKLAMTKGFHFSSYELDSAFQLLELEPGVLDGWTGWIRYPDAFDAIGDEGMR